MNFRYKKTFVYIPCLGFIAGDKIEETMRRIHEEEVKREIRKNHY